MNSGDEAFRLFEAAMAAIKRGDAAGAEEIARQMWLQSDAEIIRNRIAAMQPREGAA